MEQTQISVDYKTPIEGVGKIYGGLNPKQRRILGERIQSINNSLNHQRSNTRQKLNNVTYVLQNCVETWQEKHPQLSGSIDQLNGCIKEIMNAREIYANPQAIEEIISQASQALTALMEIFQAIEAKEKTGSEVQRKEANVIKRKLEFKEALINAERIFNRTLNDLKRTIQETRTNDSKTQIRQALESVTNIDTNNCPDQLRNILETLKPSLRRSVVMTINAGRLRESFQLLRSYNLTDEPDDRQAYEISITRMQTLARETIDQMA
ncbi:MAG: hypothetical protein AAB373_04120 [Patescibacteria group bacterium]